MRCVSAVDEAFESLLCDILGEDFVHKYKRKRPAGFIDLMIAFESRKRSYSPNKLTCLNIALPYSLIHMYKSVKGKDVSIIDDAQHNARDPSLSPSARVVISTFLQIGSAINNFGNRDVSWASHGMMRMDVKVMKRLFQKPLSRIIEVGQY